MKIGYMSDLHLRYNGDEDVFLNKLPSGPVVYSDGHAGHTPDIQIIAGDVLDGTHDVRPLVTLCERFKDIPIVYVPGNHEYFSDSDPEVTEDRLKALQEMVPNLYVLINESVKLKGIRFVGTTLWYRMTPEMMARHPHWADVRLIKRLVEFTNDRFLQANALLSNVQEGDIVVTHMLPSWTCVDPKFVGADTNELFVRDVEDIIREKKPAYWIHGHAHCHVDFKIGETRVLCNPRGITRYSEPENKFFNPGRQIEWNK